MPHSLPKKIGKYDTDLRPQNMVLSNNEEKNNKVSGVVQVDVVVGTIIRPTLFMVISTKENYNLLLGREWIHGAGEVSSTLHHRISIWSPDGIVENIEEDQIYLLTEVNHIDMKTLIENWRIFHHVCMLEQDSPCREMCSIQ